MPRINARWGWAAVLAAALLLAGQAGAARRGGGAESPLLDLLEIIVLDRHLLAIDAGGGGQKPERLERDEQVLWTGSRGRIGVVLTDRRILAVSTRSGSWQATRYRRSEAIPDGALLGDRVALIVTTQRVIGFDGGSGNLVESSVGPQETVLASEVGENVAVVVTSRRALGLSPFVGGFFQTRIRLGERIERLDARANLGTVTTSQRILIFRSPSGSWERRLLDLD